MGVGISSLIQHIRWAPNLTETVTWLCEEVSRKDEWFKQRSREEKITEKTEKKKEKKKYDDDKVLF